ncbi:MAG TPA: hypothetical protein VGN79_12500 [Devosia sp.]|jgi:hypothetical protein|nr:hypothetical protein [Devosia sp.]
MTVKSWFELEEAAAQGFGDGVLCAAILTCLERGNQPETIRAVIATGGSGIGRLMRDSMFFRMHMVAARAWAPVRHKDDLHLRTAIEFLAANPSEVTKQEVQRRDSLAEAGRLFEALDQSDLHRRIERMRHKEMAHVARYGEDPPRPVIKDVFRFVQETCAIWEALAFGAGVAYVSIDSQVAAYRRSAASFWDHFEGLSAKA